MAGGCWRIASGLLLPVAVAGLAGCGNGTGHPVAATASAAAKSSNGALTSAVLRGALLTRVNGVAAAGPASSGTYASLTTSAAKQAAGAVQVTPKACAGAATVGFNAAALAGAPAAAVTFEVGTNEVSEVLVASSAASAATALAGRVPAECAQYEENVGGKTLTYSVKEQPVTGIGEQAQELNVHPQGGKSGDLWSLIYRGTGFIGTVTVVGPNASEQAVQELGEQAYGNAAKSLS
jgi:hypothetical protein